MEVKILKWKQRKVWFVILLVLWTVFILPKSAYASYGREYVAVAWDEEFAWAPGTVLYKYTWVGSIIPLVAETYNEWQWSRVLYHFHRKWGSYVQIEVIGTVEFDSEDSGNLQDTLYEAIAETGFQDGLYFGGKLATILMVWTLQDNDNLGGGCLPEERAFIVKQQEPCYDDNTILHELTHIWIGDIPPADTPHGECLMSRTKKFMGLYNEPLQPEWGHITLSLYEEQEWGYFSYEWCDSGNPSCTSLMENHLSETYPPPPDPWMEELNRDPTYRIIFWIVVVSLILSVGYLLLRISKKYKIKIIKDKSSNFNLLVFIMLSGSVLVSVGKFFEGTGSRQTVAYDNKTRHFPTQRHTMHSQMIRQKYTI